MSKPSFLAIKAAIMSWQPGAKKNSRFDSFWRSSDDDMTGFLPEMW